MFTLRTLALFAISGIAHGVTPGRSGVMVLFRGFLGGFTVPYHCRRSLGTTAPFSSVLFGHDSTIPMFFRLPIPPNNYFLYSTRRFVLLDDIPHDASHFFDTIAWLEGFVQEYPFPNMSE